MPVAVRRGFAEISEGQVHYHIARPAAPSARRPIVLFHASPESSRTLIGLLSILGEDRVAIAFDTLGQGESCPPVSEDVTMGYFADAVARALAVLGSDYDHVDVFGTHTGARIAAELAIGHPDRVGRLIIDGMRRAPTPLYHEYAASVDLSHYIDQEGTQFFKAWIKRRDQYLFFPPYLRDAAHLRGHTLPPAAEMHDAALDVFRGIRWGHIPYRLALLYPAETRLPLLTVPTMVSCAPLDGPFGEMAYIATLIPGSVAMRHPQDSAIGGATPAELVVLAKMFTDWLDSCRGAMRPFRDTRAADATMPGS